MARVCLSPNRSANATLPRSPSKRYCFVTSPPGGNGAPQFRDALDMAAQFNLLDQQRLTRAAIFGALVGEMDLVGAGEFGDGKRVDPAWPRFDRVPDAVQLSTSIPAAGND